MHLNPAQAETVTNVGIQLIIAGPGSGKTEIIVEKTLKPRGHTAGQPRTHIPGEDSMNIAANPLYMKPNQKTPYSPSATTSTRHSVPFITTVSQNVSFGTISVEPTL